jgi:sec-independent protein translocase protein TatA
VQILGWTIGGWELILILAVMLLLFGSSKLPKLARALGASMTEFKKGLKGEPDSGAKKNLEEGEEEEEESAAKKED